VTPVPRRYPGETAIVCGTGPSITAEVIAACNKAHSDGRVRIFTANRAYQIFDTDVFHACNWQFYEHWWHDLKDRPFDKWTTRPELEGKYPGVEYIEERWFDGLSKDPSHISAHHGTGPQLVNLAYLYGCTRLLLVGWDMRFPGKVTRPGETRCKTYGKRRYFGEDALTLNHWPHTGPNGEMSGLIREMETIHPEDYGIEIVNCTPDSAMRCFPTMKLEDAL